MAEFNSYLLGRARKSVGNITMCYMGRKNIVRAKVFSRKDNPTPEILAQRAKLALLGKMGRKMLPLLRKGFVGVGRGTTSNAFVQLNMPHISVDENQKAEVDYQRLQVAAGILYAPKVAVEYVEGEKSYQFTPMPQDEEEGFANASDKVYGVLLETALVRVRLLEVGTRNSTEPQTLALPDEWSPENVKVYCFATSANGRMASDSVNLTV